MKKIRTSSEDEMILDFLKAELNSIRFNDKLKSILESLNLNENIILNGNTNNKEENNYRLKIMGEYRGYPNKELFNNFPSIDEWSFVELSQEDIYNLYYIDYDYWNELSNNTSSPLEAVKSIKEGKEIFGVSNQPFIDGIKCLNTQKFPPIILITCNDEKYLIIEGHSRVTIYGFDPSKLEGSYAYVGHCSLEEMKKYDKRMINGRSLEMFKND